MQNNLNIIEYPNSSIPTQYLIPIDREVMAPMAFIEWCLFPTLS